MPPVLIAVVEIVGQETAKKIIIAAATVALLKIAQAKKLKFGPFEGEWA